ncbi:hypothetical protein [Streptacidiphilus cavernicola]|uniref:Uncharacterized protein n=1 Tax=Streptacidiphilus cavernicola TaxID=3342716 RepID=A0ABV6W4Q0_9ACTN
MTTAPPAARPAPTRYLTPECQVGSATPGFPDGCPACPHPGYQSEHLGWVPRICACACHQEEDT